MQGTTATTADQQKEQIYEVKAGDTLHSLAEEYNEPSVSSDREYVSEIRKLNHMKSSGLIPGQSLIITYYDTEYK